MKIYVSVGTHEQQFQRLLDAVRTHVGNPSDEWVVQYGVGTWDLEAPGLRSVDYLTAQEVAETLAWAEKNLAETRRQQRLAQAGFHLRTGRHRKAVEGGGTRVFAQPGENLQRTGTGHAAVQQQQVEVFRAGMAQGCRSIAA